MGQHSRSWCTTGKELVRTATCNIMGTNTRRSSVRRRMAKEYQDGNPCICIEKAVYRFQFTWMAWKERAKKPVKSPCGESWSARSILEEPTQITDQVFLGCTQRECETNHIFMTEKIKLTQQTVSSSTSTVTQLNIDTKHTVISWSYDMQRHAQISNNTPENLDKMSTPCSDDHQCKHEELATVGWLSEVCSPIVPQCLHQARIDRPDILWTVIFFRRDRSISCIHHAGNRGQYCHVGKKASGCKLGLFQDADFVGDIPRTCKNKQPFRKAAPQPKIISRDAGLLVEGIPALRRESWCENKNTNIMSNERKPIGASKTSITYHLAHTFPASVHRFLVFEDSEAVIKIIVEARKESPRWDTFPGLTELILTGYLIKPILTRPSKPNMWTPTDVLTKVSFWQERWLNWHKCSI